MTDFGVPENIQCDYDPRFLGGIVRRLLHSHGVRVRSSPPTRQSQNGLVERTWSVICRMARCLLTDAQLPKSFWLWAVREACHRLNMTPRLDPANGSQMTPFETFFGRKPDARVLFPFGCVGYYRVDSPTFTSESRPGIALGRSDYTNGLIFYNPLNKTFAVSADYTLDEGKAVRSYFERIVYDGGFDAKSLHSRSRQHAEPLPPGSNVYAYLHDKRLTVAGEVLEVPTRSNAHRYRIRMPDNETIQVASESVWGDSDAEMDTDYTEEDLAFDPLPPSWLSAGCGITVRTDQGYKRGVLTPDDDTLWKLTVCTDDVGQGPAEYPLEGLHRNWRSRMMERELIPGWPADPNTAEMSFWLQLSAANAEDVTDAMVGGWNRGDRANHARIVSATPLKSKIAPRGLREALKMGHADRLIWLASYKEEVDGLKEQNTFDVIDEQQLKKYIAMGCEVVPSMTVFVIKPDEKGDPYRAKARTVVLGNLERRSWSPGEKRAPVLSKEGARILVSEAVSRGRKVKQGDCKNAFCQPELPDDEIVIVVPPKGCPFTKPGTYWKLNKTLYGLSRSPFHWYEKFSGVLKDLGFQQSDHDPCLWRTWPTDGSDPVWVGFYVDDFGYFSLSDKQEKWFEEELKKRFTVDFMGPISFFLGCRYDWIDQADGTLSVHISQEGYVDAVLDKFGMTDCKTASTPFRSGLPIDRIEHDASLSTERRLEIQKELQSILGCTTWLYTSTRPDIGVTNSLLAGYQCNPSPGHLDGARHLLRYLATTKDYGLAYHQNPAYAYRSWPNVDPNVKSHTYTDSNWGPQDASKPRSPELETRTVTEEECKSIQGWVVMRQHGAVVWDLNRERRISGSSCEAEIKAVDGGGKATEFVRHIEEELGIGTPQIPTPLFNDNTGAVDWTLTGKVSKKLRHCNIREWRARQLYQEKVMDLQHIAGKSNPSDILTKEHKSPSDFAAMRDIVVCPRPDGGC